MPICFDLRKVIAHLFSKLGCQNQHTQTAQIFKGPCGNDSQNDRKMCEQVDSWDKGQIVSVHNAVSKSYLS